MIPKLYLKYREVIGLDENQSHMATRDIRFNYMAGVIDTADAQRFKRILFRVTRGMTWTTLIDIQRPQSALEDRGQLIEGVSGHVANKTVFLIVYQGGSYEMMRNKLNKICDSFGASK